MRRLVVATLLMMGVMSGACSLPPDKPVTKGQLYQTRIYSNFSIKESPENVLAALNREGEVVIEGTYKGKEYYIKLFATSKGLKKEVIEK